MYDSAGTCHVQGIVAQSWAATTAMQVGEQVYNGTHAYRVTSAGNSGSTGPTFTSGSAADGSATLLYIGEIDMVLDNTNLAAGQDFKVTAFTLTDANQ